MLSIQRKLFPFWVILLLWSSSSLIMVESKCKKGCPLALASYYVWKNTTLTFIAQVMNTTEDAILSYNPVIPDKDRIQSFTRINVPFTCDCLNDGQFLGHFFHYQMIKGDTYGKVAGTYYSNLTTVNWIAKFNNFPIDNVPENTIINVPVNCSCGDSEIDKKYGLFLTYPLLPGDNLKSVAQETNATTNLLQRYNPNVNWNSGTGIVFIPAKGICATLYKKYFFCCD